MNKIYKSKQTGNYVEALQYDGSLDSFKEVEGEYYPVKLTRKEDGTILAPELGDEYEISVGSYIITREDKDEEGKYVFTTTPITQESFEEGTELCTGIEEIILTKETMQTVSDLGWMFGVDLGKPITEENKNIFEREGYCLFSLCFTSEAGAIFKADGSYKFIFDFDNENVELERIKKDE